MRRSHCLRKLLEYPPYRNICYTAHRTVIAACYSLIQTKTENKIINPHNDAKLLGENDYRNLLSHSKYSKWIVKLL